MGMKIMGWIIGFVVLAAVALMLYARLGSIDAADWHTAPDVSETETLAGGFKTQVSVVGQAPDIQIQFNQIALATPRTEILAQETELVTYVTRSAAFGFPDFSTASFTQIGDETVIKIYARLKMGKADMGVNKKRVENWLSAMSAQ
jgi:hypothetical protein